ncbi:hypothetical protein [[Eubacterium] hominis]|uniref:TMEM164 family acyltransferase n=1 Tax=[Eubacterium] hominis TaxID=2764325 RepID=UPI003A4D4218
MKDFFTFYKDITTMSLPFVAFSWIHIVFLLISIGIILSLYRLYSSLSQAKQRKFEIGMAIYFLVEEALYTAWLLWKCHDQVLLEILPLELCSLCVYMNALSVFTRKETLRFFSAVVGLVAGGVAMIYPANISGLYPVFSYRTINFYMLHGAFLLFSFIQLKEEALLSYHHMKKNFMILACMFTIAFTVNVMYHTQYMFVGIPPKITFVASLYQMTGIVFFLPTVLLILSILQVIVVYGLKKMITYTKHRQLSKIIYDI